MADLREQAEKYMMEGFAQIAAAFNLTQKRPWTFDRSVRDEVVRLLADLKAAFEDNLIRPSVIDAKVTDELRVFAARRDPAFTSLMYELTKQASDGRFVGRRARGNGGRKRRKAGDERPQA